MSNWARIECRMKGGASSSRETVRLSLLSFLASIAAVLLFLPGLPGELVFDDFHNIVNNQALHISQWDIGALEKVLAASQVSGPTRILPTLTFAFDYWRGGGIDPMVFKTTNLVIHAITTFALSWLFRSLLLVAGVREDRVRWLAPALAFAWAAHPLQVSAVLYVVQRIQTMGTLFLVLALWAYLQARRAQIMGHSGRTCLLAACFLWVVAMGCKEDSVLLPAYALSLELTVLRFRAVDAAVTSRLRRAYMVLAALGTIGCLLLIPYFWSWDAYPYRDFSSAERLMTQGRVLCLYLWQIILPLPQHMPFFYDWIEPSRNLLQPWTTLPAIALVFSLLAVAWALRSRLPLFSLGVFLFFASHFIASNVVNLELAFEHRSHFALIGIVLAGGSLLAHASGRLQVRPALAGIVCATILLVLSAATLLRAQAWRSTGEIAAAAVQGAPGSGRAWVELCAAHFRTGGGAIADNSRLQIAIATCRHGATMAPRSLNSLTLLMVLTTLRGEAGAQDWELLKQRIGAVPMTADNARVFTILVSHKRLGVPLETQHLLETLELLAQRAQLGPRNVASIGYFVMDDLGETERAMPYFIRSIDVAAPNDPIHLELGAALRSRGRPDLAEALEERGISDSHTPDKADDGNR